MPEIFKNTENFIQVGQDWLQRLKEEAKNSPNRRARLLMHTAGSDSVQEMIIAFCQDASVVVHRSPNKSESLQVLEGAICIALFDEKGKMTNRFEMGPLLSGKTFLYRIGNVPWHVIIPLTEIVVIHESLQGPFEKIDDPIPNWVPTEKTAYQVFLKNIVNYKETVSI